MNVKSICLVSRGLLDQNLLLQPWHYLISVAQELSCLGFQVTLLSDGSRLLQHQILLGMPLVRLPSVRVYPAHSPSVLANTLANLSPDLVLLHVGLTTFLNQDFQLWRRWPTIGIFTSPLYSPAELFRLGLAPLWRERSLTAIHLLGALAPHGLLCRNMLRSGLLGLVVQTETTRRQLLKHRLWQWRVDVIPPGIDAEWASIGQLDNIGARQALGFTPQDFIICYYGSPAALRGLPLLIRAVELARKNLPFIKLLVLSRRRHGEMERDSRNLQNEINLDGRKAFIHLVDGYLTREELVRNLACCNLVALPFQLVPTDAPLSLLEVKALGLPLVTTEISCLPELAEGSIHYLCPPGDPEALASSILKAINETMASKPAVLPPPRLWQTVGAEWLQFLESL